jgi:hypothetical protein
LGVPACLMKAVGASAAFAIAAALTFWCAEVEAYRPFDGTDAAVAETGEIEIELGPVEYLRAAAERMLIAPISGSIMVSPRAGKHRSRVSSHMA